MMIGVFDKTPFFLLIVIGSINSTCVSCAENKPENRCSEEEILNMNENEIVERAKKLHDATEYAEAILCLKKAIVKNRTDANLYTLLGTCYSKTGMMDRAMSNWKEAVVLSIRKSEYDNESWELLVEAAIYSKEHIDITEGLRNVSPDDIVKMAEELCSKGKFGEALYSFMIAIEKSPGYLPFYEARSVCYKKMEHTRKTDDDFRTAQKLSS